MHFNSLFPIQIDITNACNLRCQHCYHADHNNQGAMTRADISEVLKQYLGLINELKATPFIILCGGEPLTRNDIADLLTEISQFFPAIDVAILTNATLVKTQLLSDLKNVNLKLIFQVSFDGPDEESHDFYRGRGSFKKSIEGVKRLREFGFRVVGQSILSQRTCLNLKEYFSLAKNIGLESMNFTRLIGQGFGQKLLQRQLDVELSPFQLKQAYMNILLLSQIAGVKTLMNKPLMKLLHPRLGSYGHFAQGLVVDYRGNVKASSRVDLILGHIHQEGLKKIYFQHPIIKALRVADIWGCAGCEYLKECGGDRNAAYVATGDFLGPDPGCWLKEEQNNKSIKDKEVIYEEA